MDYTAIIKDSTNQVLEETKAQAEGFFTTQVLPGVKQAKDEFVAKLKTEATNSSLKVKVKNQLIIFAINFTSAVLDNIAKKVFEEKEAVETATK